MLAPFLQGFRGAGAHSVALLTRAPEATGDVPPISILQENVGGIFDVRLIRRILLISIASVFVIAVGSQPRGCFPGP